ncbi:MAG: iron-containing alcohol dehydrogenase [Chitinivibrionales bacterium]|nr:iron-containing alcohol dehydrogenase [Chitinivibrionales bacterium]
MAQIPSFSFARIPKLTFESGSVTSLPNVLAEYGSTILVVTGANSLKESGVLDRLHNACRRKDITTHWFSVSTEPSPEMVDEAISAYAHCDIAAVCAVGGGSTIDAGKAISAMLPFNEPVEQYLEGVGTKSHPGHKIPFIAVPTTAGTGSEATKNAVISRLGKDGFKKSLRHDNFVPDRVLIDPQLAFSCPPHITAACGMDAFTQLLEAYTSSKASPLTDALAYSGLQYVKDNLTAACSSQSEDSATRGALAYASFISGIVLANAGLGIVHGLASSIGAMVDIPHGVVCGTLIGEATRLNVEKLISIDPGSNLLSKYARIGRLLSNDSEGTTHTQCIRLVEQITMWIDALQIPRLSRFGITRSDVDGIAGTAGQKNNAAPLHQSDIRRMVESRL